MDNKQAAEIISRCRKENMSFRQIANELNKEGYKTKRGKCFTAMAVKRLADRSIWLQ